MADLLRKDKREFTHQLLGQNYPPSYFVLWRRWLLLLTPVTDQCQLLGIRAFAALPQHELFWRTAITDILQN
jgi:hypothetical protein